MNKMNYAIRNSGKTMAKASLTILLFCLLAFPATGSAATVTVIDTHTLGDGIPLPSLLSDTVLHLYLNSILVHGFNPATDTVNSASVSLYFRSMAAGFHETVQLRVGGEDIGTIEFQNNQPCAGVPFSGTLSIPGRLLSSGELYGDITTANGIGFDRSVLEVEYTHPDAVPVPAAAWLFGTGLIGLVGIRKKMKKAAI